MICTKCGGADASICPCGVVGHPVTIFNPPGQPALRYRSGDYAAFRHALLRAQPGETELTQTVNGETRQVWRPGAESDLAVQMMEWWAYLSDILTFYDQLIVTEAYLGTAALAESVNRLIRTLGYRPRPGLGSSATLAALLETAKPVLLPQGFKVQSKPGPGQTPQIFELTAPVTVKKPDAVSARTIAASAPLLSADGTTVWLDGTVSGIKAGEKLLLVNAGAVAGGAITAFAAASVAATRNETNVYGDPVTAVVFAAAVGTLPADAKAADFALLRSGQSARPWSVRPSGWTTAVITSDGLDLASIERSLSPGSLALIDVAGLSRGALSGATIGGISRATRVRAPAAIVGAELAPTLVRITRYSEVIWFANGNGPTPPGGDPPPIAIPVPHTHVDFSPSLAGSWDGATAEVTVRFPFASVGRLVAMPSAAEAALAASPAQLAVASAFPPGTDMPVLLQDSLGAGASASATVGVDVRTMTVGSLEGAPAAGLGPSIEVLFNLFQVTRGETVANEVLGTGNAAVASQDFTLKKAPVTYFADPASSSGDQFSSSVRAWINGLEWMEVPSFFGRAANAEIFVTREDEAGKTHVVFGDGQNGASLPTGAVVTATYRIGSGATAPAAGALTNILKPQPGLKAVANPVPPVGGADPDPPAKVRTLAPRSVLTFGRAVSLDDYRVIAASAPGVVKAEAAYSFDPIAQRPAVTVWVAGDAGAPAAAAAAIAATADPNRPVKVLAATGLDTSISLTYVRDPRRADDTLRQGLHAALLNPDKGLFGVNVIGIGEAVFDSQIYAACLAVTGVVAVESLAVRSGPRSRPFFGRRFVFRGRTPVGVAIPCTGERHDPGEGRFLSVPDDGAHLTLAGRVAS